MCARSRWSAASSSAWRPGVLSAGAGPARPLGVTVPSPTRKAPRAVLQISHHIRPADRLEALRCAPPTPRCAPPALRCAPPALRCAPPAPRCAPPALRCAPPALRCAPPALRCAPIIRAYTYDSLKGPGETSSSNQTGDGIRLPRAGDLPGGLK